MLLYLCILLLVREPYRRRFSIISMFYVSNTNLHDLWSLNNLFYVLGYITWTLCLLICTRYPLTSYAFMLTANDISRFKSIPQLCESQRLMFCANYISNYWSNLLLDCSYIDLAIVKTGLCWFSSASILAAKASKKYNITIFYNIYLKLFKIINPILPK